MTLATLIADLATANAEIVALHDELAACSNAVGTDSQLVFRDGEWTSVPVDSPLLGRIQMLRMAASVEADEARRQRAEVARLNRRLEAVEDWYPGWMVGIGWQEELRRRRHAWEYTVPVSLVVGDGDVRKLTMPLPPMAPGSHRNRYRCLPRASTKRKHELLSLPPTDYRAKTLHVPVKDNELYR